jgi:pyruvate, water dikinase
MDTPALVPLSAVAEHQPSQVGKRAVLLAQLQQAGVAIAETHIIPAETLRRLATETNLSERLKQVLKQLHWQESQGHTQLHQTLTSAIKRLELPRWFTQSIQQWYHSNPGFVSISIPMAGFENSIHEHVQGEANLLESIMVLWAQQAQIDPRSKEFKLFAQPILIQHQGQPTASGTAEVAQDPTHKTVATIRSVWGVFDPTNVDIQPDEFTVDIRTHQVISRLTHPQYIQLIRQVDGLQEVAMLHYKREEPSLTDDQVAKLSSYIGKTQRALFEPVRLSWFIENDQLFVSQVKTADEKQESNRVLLKGEPAQFGIVSGTVNVVRSAQDLSSIKIGDILVTSELTPALAPAFSQIIAVICDRGINSPLLLEQLKKQHIATIINTHQATHALSTGQQIIVDANAGLVHQAPKPLTNDSSHAPLPIATATKIYISAGNPNKAREYITPVVDGVGVLRSEFVYAKFGTHPLTIIRSSEKKKLETALHEVISAYQSNQEGRTLPIIYRSLNFTSQEARSLAHSEAFEPQEMNPYLGFRGGIKLLQNFELLDFELTMIKNHLSKNGAPLGYMLPFVRTPGEFQLLHNHIKSYRLHQFPHYSLWLQVNTPENILHIAHYLKVPVDGFSINARSIHALLHGIDPDEPEIYSYYPINAGALAQLLKPFVATIRQSPHALRGNKLHPEIALHIEDNRTELIELAVSLGLTAITVKPDFAQTAKHRIHEAEGSQLR